MKEINEWEVLTPEGWKDFSGIVEYEKTVITIKFDNGIELTGSLEHRVMTDDGMCELQNLEYGSTVKTDGRLVIVIEKSKPKQSQKVYDLVEVDSTDHQYYTNGIVSHNCDEIAFIPNRIQEEFMAGTAPSLSATRGKMMITSTPNGSRDLFAKLWFGSGMEWDKKEYTYVRKNKAKNLFTPLFVPYWIDETKNNDEWINREKKTLDDNIKWKVEFECLVEDTKVEVYDEIEEVYRTITLSEMNKLLLKDEIDGKVIISE
jgi:hypothetical protein